MATEYVEKLRIATDSIDKSVDKLSGGNQQKVVLSKCLFADADLLLLDEPTRGVDVGAKAEIYDIIRDLADDGHLGRGVLLGARGGAGHLRPHLPAVRGLAQAMSP